MKERNKNEEEKGEGEGKEENERQVDGKPGRTGKKRGRMSC